MKYTQFGSKQPRSVSFCGGAQEIAGGANTFNVTMWPPSYIGRVIFAGGAKILAGGAGPPWAPPRYGAVPHILNNSHKADESVRNNLHLAISTYPIRFAQ